MTLHISDDLDLPLEFATEAFALLARRGAGKSNALIVIAEELYANGLPFVHIDPKGDSWGIRSSGDGTGPGLAVPVFGGRHGDVPLEATAGALIADLILGDQSSYLSCVLDVSSFSKGEAKRFLHDFGDRLFRQKDESNVLTLLFEEAHEYLPQRVGRDEAQLVNVYQRIVKQGRQRGLGCGMATQRSAALNKDVLTQVGALIPMWIMSPQDRAAIKDWVEVGGEAPELIGSLHALKPGEAWIWWPERYDRQQRITFRQRWTFDSGATPKPGQKRAVPRTLADVDLAAVKEQMAETIERAKMDDPRQLRKQITGLAAELEQARRAAADHVCEAEHVEVSVLTDADRALLEDLAGRWTDVHTLSVEVMDAMLAVARRAQLLPPIEKVAPARVGADQRGSSAPRSRHTPPGARSAPGATAAQSRTGERETRPAPPSGSPDDAPPLKAGARRMVESLGRMAPLRLTTSQWGMAAKLKTTGGTWSTYLNAIKRAGLVEQNDAGWQLTAAGFEYIGGQPEPMTGEELQAHYRTALKAGAVRMLDAFIERYPGGLTKDELSEATGIVSTGGTFSTYLNTLRRNQLIELLGDEYFATRILMHGAEA